MGRFTGRIPVDSDDGQDLLDQGWEATKEEFERNLERVKEAIDELSDEEIMRDENLSRHAFHQVGAYDGPSVFLYDQHATGIRHRDSWIDSSKRVKTSGSSPPTSTSNRCPESQTGHGRVERRRSRIETPTETGARAVLHRGPDSYRYKWRAAILVDGYPVWSRGFERRSRRQSFGTLFETDQPPVELP